MDCSAARRSRDRPSSSCRRGSAVRTRAAGRRLPDGHSHEQRHRAHRMPAPRIACECHRPLTRHADLPIDVANAGAGLGDVVQLVGQVRALQGQAPAPPRRPVGHPAVDQRVRILLHIGAANQVAARVRRIRSVESRGQRAVPCKPTSYCAPMLALILPTSGTLQPAQRVEIER